MTKGLLLGIQKEERDGGGIKEAEEPQEEPEGQAEGKSEEQPRQRQPPQSGWQARRSRCHR